jgi:hypothetical protein
MSARINDIKGLAAGTTKSITFLNNYFFDCFKVKLMLFAKKLSDFVIDGFNEIIDLFISYA